MNKRSNNNKNQTAKKKKKTIVVSPSRPAVNVPHLSPCAIAYLRALSDPWTEPNQLPCVPDVIVLPSHKYQTKVRGTMVIGDAGVGWVSASPILACCTGMGGAGIFLDTPVVFTSAGYVGGSLDYSVTGGVITTPGVSTALPATNISIATLQQNGTQIRVVGSGLRVRYSGTELNRAGRLVLYRSRSGNNVPLGTAGSALLTDPTAYAEPISRGWQGVTFIPSSTASLSYQSIAAYEPTQTAQSSSANRSLLAFVDGAIKGTSFEFELTSYYEIIGVNQDATPSHADPVGYGAILSSLPESVTSVGRSTYNMMYRNALVALERTTSGLFQMGAAAAATSISMMMQRQPAIQWGGGPAVVEL